MQIELLNLQYTLYEYIDWVTPTLLKFERWLSDSWSQLQFDPAQIELAAL